MQKCFSFWRTSFPRPPTGDPHLDSAGGLPSPDHLPLVRNPASTPGPRASTKSYMCICSIYTHCGPTLATRSHAGSGYEKQSVAIVPEMRTGVVWRMCSCACDFGPKARRAPLKRACSRQNSAFSVWLVPKKFCSLIDFSSLFIYLHIIIAVFTEMQPRYNTPISTALVYDNHDHATISIKALPFHHNKAQYTHYSVHGPCSLATVALTARVRGCPGTRPLNTPVNELYTNLVCCSRTRNSLLHWSSVCCSIYVRTVTLE